MSDENESQISPIDGDVDTGVVADSDSSDDSEKDESFTFGKAFKRDMRALLPALVTLFVLSAISAVAVSFVIIAANFSVYSSVDDPFFSFSIDSNIAWSIVYIGIGILIFAPAASFAVVMRWFWCDLRSDSILRLRTASESAAVRLSMHRFVVSKTLCGTILTTLIAIVSFVGLFYALGFYLGTDPSEFPDFATIIFAYSDTSVILLEIVLGLAGIFACTLSLLFSCTALVIADSHLRAGIQKEQASDGQSKRSYRSGFARMIVCIALCLLGCLLGVVWLVVCAGASVITYSTFAGDVSATFAAFIAFLVLFAVAVVCAILCIRVCMRVIAHRSSLVDADFGSENGPAHACHWFVGALVVLVLSIVASFGYLLLSPASPWMISSSDSGKSTEAVSVRTDDGIPLLTDWADFGLYWETCDEADATYTVSERNGGLWCYRLADQWHAQHDIPLAVLRDAIEVDQTDAWDLAVVNCSTGEVGWWKLSDEFADRLYVSADRGDVQTAGFYPYEGAWITYADIPYVEDTSALMEISTSEETRQQCALYFSEGNDELNKSLIDVAVNDDELMSLLRVLYGSDKVAQYLDGNDS